MDAVGSAGVTAAAPADEFAVLEVQPVKELSEAEQVRALTQGLGLDDPSINEGRGLNGFGGADDSNDAGLPARAGAPVHQQQPGRVKTPDAEPFETEARELGQMGVEIKGGAKPLGNQAVSQAIAAQGVVFGPGGLAASNVVPLVGRGDRKPEDNLPGAPKMRNIGPPPKPPAGAAPAGFQDPIPRPTTREELEAAKAELDRQFEETQRAAEQKLAAASADLYAGAYPAHPGEDIADAAITLTRGQLNTIQRLLDTPIPDARALVAAIALKASVEVAGIEGLTMNFTTAELAEIDRRASFWSMTRAQAVAKMIEIAKPVMFDASSM